MKTYIIFLRGVNVSGKNLIKMAELKQYLTLNGFTNVSTYIQSGNIVVQSDLDKKGVEKHIGEIILKHFDIAVPVIDLYADEVAQAFKNNPLASDVDPNNSLFTFINVVPDEFVINELS